MHWKKLALILSVVWLMFLIIGCVFASMYINSNPGGTLSQEDRFEKLGMVFGFLWIFGTAAIWLILRRRNAQMGPAGNNAFARNGKTWRR